MNPVFILLAELAALLLLTRWLYLHFILPASLSKNAWYTDYLQLCDFIKQVDSYSLLDGALVAFYKFSGNKQEMKNPEYQYCIRRVVKLLKKKYLLYKNKTLIA